MNGEYGTEAKKYLINNVYTSFNVKTQAEMFSLALRILI